MTARRRLVWYLVAVLSAILTALAAILFGETVLASDRTYITAGIVAMYLLATVYIGVEIHRGRPCPMYWPKWLVGVMPALGLIGTLVGIAALFGLSGEGDEAATLAALGTAIYTTLAGLIYSECLWLQLKILTRDA